MPGSSTLDRRLVCIPRNPSEARITTNPNTAVSLTRLVIHKTSTTIQLESVKCTPLKLDFYVHCLSKHQTSRGPHFRVGWVPDLMKITEELHTISFDNWVIETETRMCIFPNSDFYFRFRWLDHWVAYKIYPPIVQSIADTEICASWVFKRRSTAICHALSPCMLLDWLTDLHGSHDDDDDDDAVRAPH